MELEDWLDVLEEAVGFVLDLSGSLNHMAQWAFEEMVEGELEDCPDVLEGEVFVLDLLEAQNHMAPWAPEVEVEVED